MAKKQNTKKSPSVISLRALCEKASIPHHKVYANLNGTYDSMEHVEKTKLANTLYNEITPFLKTLGFYIQINRIKDPVQQ
jgi:hypothetical protein